MDIAYDTETTGLKTFLGHRIFSFSTCDPEGKIDVTRIDGKGLPRRDGLAALEKLWADRKIVKVMHNAKFDLNMTEVELGRRLAEDHPFHDTMIQSHIVRNQHQTHGLKDLAWELAGIPNDDEKAIKKYLRGHQGNFSRVPVELMHKYQERDAKRTMLLHLFFHPQIQANPRYQEIYDNEIELVRVTLRMEQRGLMVNEKRCKQLIRGLSDDAGAVQEEARDQLGYPVRLGNPGDVRKLLFKRMGLPVIERTPTGIPCADKNVLAALRQSHPSPILDMILKYRAWTRGVSTLQSYLDWMDENGIIHTSIHTFGAYRTARESSSDPNLQNVSKAEAMLNPFPIPARKAFRPRPGYVNFHIDYAGIELRLLVHYSDDEKFVKELNSKRDDPHSLAAQVFYPAWTKGERAHYAQWLPEERRSIIIAGFDAFKKGDDGYKLLRTAAKNANFAIPYGANFDRVAGTLGVPAEIGAKRFAVYQEEFPLICGLSRKVADRAKQEGRIETAFGRHLWVPQDKAYVGTNYLIQGSAADVLKRAQVRVHKYLEKATGGEVGILLPIHDEIIIEYPRKRLSEAQHIFKNIKKLMEDFPMFKVPMKIEIDVAYRDWATKHKFELED